MSYYASFSQTGGTVFTDSTVYPNASQSNPIIVFNTPNTPTATNTLTINSTCSSKILIIGGGGGAAGGGGGAGEFYEISSQSLSSGIYTITVGKGGQAAPDKTTAATQGGYSRISNGTLDISANGGGNGGLVGGSELTAKYGGAGGSSGGAGSAGNAPNATSVVLYNKSGGKGNIGTYKAAYGGGGGAGGAGGATDNATGGSPGIGIKSNVLGGSTLYAGGGCVGGGCGQGNNNTKYTTFGSGGSGSSTSNVAATNGYNGVVAIQLLNQSVSKTQCSNPGTIPSNVASFPTDCSLCTSDTTTVNASCQNTISDECRW